MKPAKRRKASKVRKSSRRGELPAEPELAPPAGVPEIEELEEPETLSEAESEVGISEWIDPETGLPAEDSVPRIEDH